MEQVFNDVFQENSQIKHCPVISVWEDLCKVKAEKCFSEGNELDGVFHLSEAHCIYLRHKVETSINYLVRRTQQNDGTDNQGAASKDFAEFITPSMKQSLVAMNSRFSVARGQGIIERLKDLPQEWTIVQITSAADVQFSVNPKKHHYSSPPSLYITRMECGPNPTVISSKVDLLPNTNAPACRQFFPMSSRVTKSFLEELKDIIKDEESVVKNGKKFTPKCYWEKRNEHGNRMKVLLSSIENKWLRGWKIFFMGKLLNAEDAVRLDAMVNSVLASSGSTDIPARSRDIISLLLGAMPNLQHAEVHRMLRDAIPDASRKQIFDLMDAIIESCSTIKPCKWKRHPVILILDKRVEGVPWEMMPTLQGHPYSRVPSLHLAHYFTLESRKVMEAYVDASQGYYIVNPDKSLPATEKMMVEYLERRPEIWKGKSGEEVSPEEFEEAIREHQVLLYSGHGSGSQHMRYMRDTLNHTKPAKGVVMVLMGCSSVKTDRLAPHLDPWGPVYQHLLCRSPCVVGMMWPVTDIDCNKVTIKLLDVWLGPAQGEENKKKDAKTKAEEEKAKGCIQFTSRRDIRNGLEHISSPEDLQLAQGDLIRAMNESKYAATQMMTSTAMVAYGIPVIATKGELASLSHKLNKMSLK